MLKKLTFLVLLPFIISAQEIETLEAELQKIHEQNPQVAISIGLLQNGEVQYYNFGENSRSQEGIAVSPKSVYEIASITKAITGNLVCQAVLEGKFNLEDYIDAYLPSQYQLPKVIQKSVKISDLLSHQSGLPDVDFVQLIKENPQQPTAKVNDEQLAQLLNTCEGLVDKGQYRYSTIGFVLLGQILEEVYEKSYEKLIQERLIDHLSMNSTFTSDFQVGNVVTGYNREGGLQEAFVWNCVAPAGLIKSSSKDMMLYLNEVLDAQSEIGKAAILQEQPLYLSDDIEIAGGINVLRDEAMTIYAKTGDSMGHSTVLGYERSKNWGVVIFINQNNGALRNLLFNTIANLTLSN